MDKVNKSRKVGRWIKMEISLQKLLISAAICMCVCVCVFFYVFGWEMAGQMGNE